MGVKDMAKLNHQASYSNMVSCCGGGRIATYFPCLSWFREACSQQGQAQGAPFSSMFSSWEFGNGFAIEAGYITRQHLHDQKNMFPAEILFWASQFQGICRYVDDSWSEQVHFVMALRERRTTGLASGLSSPHATRQPSALIHIFTLMLLLYCLLFLL